MAEDLRDLDAGLQPVPTRLGAAAARTDRWGATGRRSSPLLFELFEVAMAVAVRTAGIVDPTVGSALIELGYDRDFDQIADHQRVTDVPPEPAPGWWRIELDPDARTVAVPPGVHLDLGATAKALAADRAADRIAAELGCGALVNLGGDVAVAGSGPAGGWAVGIAARCTDAPRLGRSGGRRPRRWPGHVGHHGHGRGCADGRTVHHIIDPWTGAPAAPGLVPGVDGCAPTCVEANAWSTAAVVWGDDAAGNLDRSRRTGPAGGADGRVVHVGDWPSETRTRREAQVSSADDGRGVR